MNGPTTLRGKRVYLDANIFINAVEGFAPYDAILREMFTLIEQRSIRVATSEITLAEVLVLPLRENRSDLADTYHGLLSPTGPIQVVSVSREILVRSAELRAQAALKPFDAIHVATARIAKADVFLSDDRRLDSAPIPKMTLENLRNA